MFDPCKKCGHAPEGDRVALAGAFAAVCPRCGGQQPLRTPPLVVVTGPPGVGKTTLYGEIIQREDRPDLVYFETDSLMGPLSERGWEEFKSWQVWIALNIAQSGRPAVLFGSGVPAEYERAGRRDRFAAAHYLALVCGEGALRRRLAARPPERMSSRPEMIEQCVAVNRELQEGAAAADPPYALLDTSTRDVRACGEALVAWLVDRGLG